MGPSFSHTLSVAISVLAVLNVAAAASTVSSVLCTTKYGPTSTSSVKSVTNLLTVPLYAYKITTVTPQTTVTPAATTSTVSKTITLITTTNAAQQTDTFSSTSTFYDTATTITQTATQSTTLTSTFTSFSSPTTTVPASSGFQPLKSSIPNAAKRDVNGALAVPAIENRAATAVSCPSSDGTTVVSNGASFVVECGIDHQAGDLSSQAVSSFQGCIDACSNKSACVDVSFVSGTCYLKSSVGARVTNGAYGARKLVSSTSSTAATATSTSAVSLQSSTTTASAVTYPTAVTCAGLVEVISTSTITTTATTTHTNTASGPTNYVTRTVTTTSTSTLAPAHAATTLSFTYISTIIQTASTTTTLTFSETATIAVVAPTSTYYAACSADNIIRTIGGVYISGALRPAADTGVYTFGTAASPSTPYDCCVSCITTAGCAGTLGADPVNESPGGYCQLLMTTATCTQSNVGFSLITSGPGVNVGWASNGYCGHSVPYVYNG